MSAVHRLVVVVPARDEEERIGGCLGALGQAAVHARAAHPQVSVSVTVVLDRCRDATREVVERFRPPGTLEVHVVESPHGKVGAARAIGVEHALRTATVPLESVWIANTDADSVVPADWVERHLYAAADGVDVLLGTVRPDGDGLVELGARLHALAAAHVQPGQVYGANLGVRASAYRSVGGFSPDACDEDRGLVARLHAAAVHAIASSGSSPVVTSSRTAGRAPRGYADFLRRLSADDPPEPVAG